jgi:hypothetical protein
MEDAETRLREGKQLALVKKAVDKEAKRLGSPHRYANNVEDLPLLNAETIQDLDKE